MGYVPCITYELKIYILLMTPASKFEYGDAIDVHQMPFLKLKELVSQICFYVHLCTYVRKATN
jgi:hypothetical protein